MKDYHQSGCDKYNGGFYDIIIHEHFQHLSKIGINYSLNELLINGLLK